MLTAEANDAFVTYTIVESTDLAFSWNISNPSESISFYLPQATFHSFEGRPEVEMQLKCLREVDKVYRTYWPAEVKVLVNDQIVIGELTSERRRLRPVYIRQLCVPGTNTLVVSNQESDKFTLILRPIRRVPAHVATGDIVHQQFLPVTEASNFVKEVIPLMYPNTCPFLPRTSSVRISLNCPSSFVRIRYPARTRQCQHIQCFDLEQYLNLDMEPDSWKCPICDIPTSLNDLIVDGYFQKVISDALSDHPHVDSVIIEDCGEWAPYLKEMTPQQKKENEESHLRFPCYDDSAFQNLWIEQVSEIDTTVFNLTPGFASVLALRSDLEVELQCFQNKCCLDHVDNPLLVNLNKQKMMVNWAGRASGWVSFDTKRYLKQDENSLMIVKQGICGQHAFSLHLVHRPSVKSVIEYIIPRDFRFAHETLAEVREFVLKRKEAQRRFKLGPRSLRKTSNEGVLMEMLCPISKKKIDCPAKLRGCDHLECFDLLTFLRQAKDFRKKWKCPVCNIEPPEKRFIIDSFLWDILLRLKKENVQQILVLRNGHWFPCY